MQLLTHNFTSKIKFKPFNGWLKIASLVVLLVLCFGSFAQNLVINSSFEKYSDCPSGPSQLERALKCTSPYGNEGEYLNVCSTDPFGWYSVPNQGGTNYQYPHFGDAFISLYLLNGGYGANVREYVQMELFSTLTNNSLYYVEFWTNRGSGSWGGEICD